jgi:peptidoglycan/xylan/chitin deacetylase (PgdA/CDA1 family)
MKENRYKKMFTLSFDDGTVQDRRFVALIDQYNLKCTFNLNSGLFGSVHNINHGDITVCHDEVARTEVKELYINHEIAVHTVTHPNLLHCTKEQIISEVNNDYVNLTALTDSKIQGMAYPGGPFYNDFVIETILQHTPIRYARTIASHHTFQLPENFMTWHPTCHQNDQCLMQLANDFIQATPDHDMLFYLWGHTFEFDIYNTWDAFEEFCRLICNHNDICYMTNGEVYEYLCSKSN